MTLPSTAVETAIVQCTSRCAMARGNRLNTSIVLAAVHGLSGLFRAVSAVEPSLSRPRPTPLPVLNKQPRFCGRKAIWSRSWMGESVSRFGLAVRRQAGKQRHFGSNPLRFSFLFKSCGLWTLSCDSVPHNYETLKWLPILMQESFLVVTV